MRIPTPTRPIHSYRVLIPLGLLLALQLVLVVLIGRVYPPRIGPAVVLIIGTVLGVGLLPAFLRPGYDSVRIGEFAVLLAGLIWQASTAGLAALPSFDVLARVLHDPRPVLGLTNAALMAPTMLHIVARFPRRSTISDTGLILAYALFGGLVMVIVPVAPAARLVLLNLIALMAYVVLGVAAWLLLRAIRDPSPERGYAIIQARLIFVSFIFSEGTLLALPIVGLLNVSIPYQTMLVMQLCFPAGIAYAILRHDLFGIDAAVRRALAYAGASLGSLAVYFGLTAILTVLLRESMLPNALPVTVIGVLGAAAAFPWWNRSAHQLINRAFYPERLTFQHDIEVAQAALTRVVRREEVLRLLTADLPDRLGAVWAHVHLLPDSPSPQITPAWIAPLLVGGQELGIYRLGPRRTGLPYAPHEQAQLQALVQQAALALAYAETVEALEMLNVELEARVTARTEQLLAQQRELAAVAERQRLARDLHDSLKQTLFSLGLNLRVAAGMIQRDPESARRLLQQQETIAVQAQSDMSDLLTELRGAGRQQRDLAATLRDQCAALAERYRLQLHCTVPERLAMPDTFVCELIAVTSEGIHNIAKHSGSADACVTLVLESEVLQLTICDHGCGFDLAHSMHSGHGLRGMSERVATLGGELKITSLPGEGTTVWVQVPFKR